MSRGVQPKKVAPLIRGARYTFLIAGWFYGSGKKAVYLKIEETEAAKRKAALKEELLMKKKQDQEINIKEFKKLFAEFGFDPEPGWEDVFD